MFFQVCCKPGNHIQQDLLQHKHLLLCAAVREVFIALKSLPVWHRRVCPGQAGQGAFRKKARNPLAHVSSLPPQGAAREETRTQRQHCGSFNRAREHDGWREQSCAPPGHCASQPSAPAAAAGGCPPQVLARPGLQAQPLTLTPQQTRAPPATRCPHTSEPGQLPASQRLSPTQ